MKDFMEVLTEWRVYPEECDKGEMDMKRTYKGFIAMAIVFFISPVVDAQLYRGEKLVEDWKAYKSMSVPKSLKSPALVQRMGNYVGYVAGVYDANYDIFVLPADVTVDQLCNAVGKYLDEHQNELHEPAISHVLRGFSAMVSREVPPKKK